MRLVSSLDSLTLLDTNKGNFYCLVESNQVSLESSWTSDTSPYKVNDLSFLYHHLRLLCCRSCSCCHLGCREARIWRIISCHLSWNKKKWFNASNITTVIENRRIKSYTLMVSGCDTIESTVISDTGEPRFESSHQQLFLKNYLLFVEKTKIKKNMPGVAYSMWNFADDWIWTADLWYWKRPLCQLSHNHYPKIKAILCSCI